MDRVSCPQCPKTFVDQNGLWMHAKAKHGASVARGLKPAPSPDNESMGDFYRALKDRRRDIRAELGRECPDCPSNRHATILLPGQVCRVDGYRDPRQPQAKAA